MIDRQILGFCLNNDFFGRAKNILDRTMFQREMRDIFDTLTYHHTTYDTNITVGELAVCFLTVILPCLTAHVKTYTM